MEYHKGKPDLGEFILPSIEPKEVMAIFLGAIDAAKDRTRKEVLKEVFEVMERLRGKDGCVAVDVFKRVMGEKDERH